MTAKPEDVLARVAVLLKEIPDPVSGSGVYAYSNIPYTISAVDMPLFVTFPGALIGSSVLGSDEKGREIREERNFQMILYHSPFGAGIEEEKTGLLVPYLELVHAKFALYPRLRNLGEVIEAGIMSDSGPTTVSFINQNYFGVRFTLRVVRRVRRLYGEND